MTTRLESAIERLEAALTRVEACLANRPSAGGGDQVRDLAEQLAHSRAENQELAQANVSVAARLDSAIDRLRAVLRT